MTSNGAEATHERDSQALRALGQGLPLDAIEDLGGRGPSAAEVDAWWAAQLDRRLPDMDARLAVRGLGAAVEILRDERGLPHVFAASDVDLFVGYGYAQAQDRLFQLDMQRRKGRGTLAALIGPDGLAWDRVAATFDFEAVLARHLAALDSETRVLLEAFARGVEAAAGNEPLPIEHDLLGAPWEPWSVTDSLACALAWRWQFTGRPHVVAGPEVLRRRLGDEALLRALLAAQREADTPILPPDAPRPAGTLGPREGPGHTLGELEPRGADAPGSNDWVVAGWRATSGSPLLASDPHMPYQHVSAFHEVGLHGGSFDAVGGGLVGMAGLLFGRNRSLAWGMTNNICSQRDLYQERAASGLAGGPEAFEFDGRVEPAQRRDASIEVRDAGPLSLTVLRTRNGPIVDALLPPWAAGTGPVSMRWLGTEVCDFSAALLRITRARSVAQAMAACEGWLVPTFSMVFADVAGSIGYLATGRIPLRTVPERGYRPGWDPAHQWQGLVPAEGMPRSVDPARGWLASANNRPAPDDWSYPLAGTFDEALRFRRIGSLIESASATRRLDLGDMARMHADVRSLRAVALKDAMLTFMGPLAGPAEAPLLDAIRAWDGESTTGSAGAAAWNVLFTRWAQAVMAERIGDRGLADDVSGWGLGLAAQLVRDDEVGWFAPGRREAVARVVLTETLEELRASLGADPAGWAWGRLHQLRLPHTLSSRGALGRLLDKGPVEVPGDLTTLNNSGYDASRPVQGQAEGESRAWWATSGAGYRLEVDLGQEPPAAWTITLESQSGRPGSAHYDDQRADFLAGRTRRLPLDRAEVEPMARHRTRLEPGAPT